MLDKSKLALLAVAKKQLVLSEEDYRAILENVGGSRSAKGLDDLGFGAVMDRMRELGFTSTARQRSYGERPGFATPGQVQKIRALFRRWADDPSDANLNSFLEHKFGVSALRFLPAAKVSGVVAALTAMVAKKERTREDA
jgi:phage gp16-like protein